MTEIDSLAEMLPLTALASPNETTPLEEATPVPPTNVPTPTEEVAEPVTPVTEPTLPTFDSPLPTPSLPETADIVWTQHRPQPSEETLALSPAGGRLATRDNAVTFDFPAQAVDAPLELEIKVLVPENPYQGKGGFRWLTVDVEPVDKARLVEGHLRLAQPVTISLDLTGFPAWLEPYLVQQVDAERDIWELLPAHYDQATQRLTGQVAMFSQVGAVGGAKFPDSATHYLLTNPPDVSTFSGAAGYSYDLQLPAGRRGLTPDLSLSYSSAALNGVMGSVQSNYVGSGWSLGGMVSIVRKIKSRVGPIGSSDPLPIWEYVSTFTLILGGTSYHLSGPEKLGSTGGCRYYAEDAPQLLVMRYTTPGNQNQHCGYGPYANETPPNTSKEYWVVTTADGTQYRLGFTADAEQLTRMDGFDPSAGYNTLTGSYWGGCAGGAWCMFAGYAGQAPGRVTYQWAVDRVRDVYSNTITYGYAEEYSTTGGYQWDRAHYPAWIRYTANSAQSTVGPYVVQFILEDRLRAPGVWHDDGLRGETLLINQRPYAMWDEKRIDRIRVCVNLSANTCPDSSASLAEYDLGYQFVTEEWPGYEWIINTIQHETTRLTSITKYGWNAQGQKVALPSTTFTYASYNQADNNTDPADGAGYGGKLKYPRLTAVSNGYGGQVTFTYDQPIGLDGVYSYRVLHKDTSDGLNNTARTTYTYAGPCFSRLASGSNCRRSGLEDATYALIGHQATTVAAYDYDSVLLNKTTYTFITDATVNRGKTSRTQVYNPSNQLLQQQDTTWAITSFGPTGYAVPVGYVVQTLATDYKGSPAATTRVDYSYDAYGNVTAEYQYGAVDPVTHDNTSAYQGDECSIHRVYYPDTSAWIMSNVARESIYAGIRSDDNNTSYLKSRTRYRYDGQSCWNLAPPPGAKGALTAVDRWFGPRGGAPADCHLPDYDITTYAYDAWGNVTDETDPLGHTTTTNYETTYRQFPTWVRRHTGTQYLYSYTRYYGSGSYPINEEVRSDDYGLFGQVQKTYDSNGEAATSIYYAYDAFGRLVEEVRPNDSLASPTSRYVYHEPSSAPVANPGFESSLNGSWIEYDPSNIQTYTQDSTQAYAGTKSLKIVTSSTTDHWVGQYLNGWQAGQSYQVHVYVKTTTSGKLCLNFSAKAGHEAQAACRVATGAWELIIATMTLPTDATQFLLLLRTPQVGTVYVDNTLYAVSAYAKEDAAGNSLWQRQVYDGLGRVLQTQAEYNGAQATVVDQRYDARGLVVAQSVPYLATSSVDAPWYVAPAAPAQALTGYNARGQINQTTAPDGSISYIRYYGRQTATLDALGHLKISVADAYGQLVEVREYMNTYTLPFDWAALATSYYARTRYAYNTLGNLTTVTDTLGNVTTMVYDKLSRKTDMYDPDMGHWTYTYGNAGNLKTQTDARSCVTTFTYDNLNRLTNKVYSGSLSQCNNTPDVTYTYDAFSSGTNYGRGQRTGMSDTAGGSATWTYDTRGRVTQETKTIAGQLFTTGYTYDSLDRVVTTTYPDGEVVRNTYNGAGQPATLRSDTYSYNYVSSAAYTAPGSMATMAYGNGITTNYDYYDTAAEIDPQTNRAYSFRLRRMWTSNDLLDLSYRYDDVGNVKRIDDTSGTTNETLNYTYDALDRLTNVSGAYARTFAYNAIGNLMARDAFSYAYDAPKPPNVCSAGTPNTKPHAVQSAGFLGNFSYDCNGNMTGHSTAGTLSYNAENKLATASGPNGAFSYTYDGDSNLVMKTTPDGTTRYVGPHYEAGPAKITLDAAPLNYGVACLDSATGTGYLMYSAESLYTRFATQPPYSNNAAHFICVKYSSGWKYDNNSTYYAFTPRDTDILVAAVDFSADTVTDLKGQSGDVYGITKGYADGNLTFYADKWNGSTNDGEFSISGDWFTTNARSTVTKSYFFGSQRVAMRQGSILTYLHGDHLGSASLSTDASGGKTADMRYYPYGERRSGGVFTDRRYTGQREEAGLGLYDYNARYYDPYLNRFIQADTIVPSPANPRDLNRYAYAANNPLSFIDPNGHQIRPPDTCGAICYTGTTGPYNVAYASPAAQPLTVGTNQSANDYYWTAPSTPLRPPGDAGVIMRYQTNFEATPKLVTVYAPVAKGPEMQNVWRYESGRWIHSREDHFALGAEIPGTNIGIGFDYNDGSANPEVSAGLVVWGGNELMLEGKILGSGGEAGFEYGAAGDFYVITTGDKFNNLGPDIIGERYIQRDAIFRKSYAFQSYEEARDWFLNWNRYMMRETEKPLTFRMTE